MAKDITADKGITLPVFSRDQILNSKKLNHSPDILRTVLKEDRKYSLDEVGALVQAFKERVI